MPYNSDRWRLSVRLALTVTVVASLLVLLPFSYSCITGLPTKINCKSISIDIMSGRLLRERYFWWIRISNRIDETAVSHFCKTCQPDRAEWRVVCNYDPISRVSPHYFYHGSEYAISRIADAFNSADFTERARDQIVSGFLKFLQIDGNDHRASEYAEQIWRLGKGGGVIDRPQLPGADMEPKSD